MFNLKKHIKWYHKNKFDKLLLLLMASRKLSCYTLKVCLVLSLQLAELFVSSTIRLLYGFCTFSSAVAGDLSRALNECLFKPNMNVVVTEDVPKRDKNRCWLSASYCVSLWSFWIWQRSMWIFHFSHYSLEWVWIHFSFRAFYAFKLSSSFFFFFLGNLFWVFRDWDDCRIFLRQRNFRDEFLNRIFFNFNFLCCCLLVFYFFLFKYFLI